MLRYFVAATIGFGVTLALTPVFARLAESARLMAIPGGRHRHERPIPCAGGAAVFLGFHAAAAAVLLLPWGGATGQPAAGWWWRFLPLSAGVLILGIADDSAHFRPLVKLLGQVAVALSAFALGLGIHSLLGVGLPAWAAACVTVGWYLLVINAFNLIDGIDGLATGLAAIASMGLIISMLFQGASGAVPLLLGLGFACVGFLHFNFQPARVFLGDSGSMFLGFAIAAIAVESAGKGAALASLAVPLFAIGVPLIDTVLAVWRRTVRGLNGHIQWKNKTRMWVFHPDRDHLHHRLLRSGLSHRRAAGALYLLAAAFVATGVLVQAYGSRSRGIALLAFVCFAVILVRYLAPSELWESGDLLLRGIERPTRQRLASAAYPVIDLTAFSLALLAAVELGPPLPGHEWAWTTAVPIWIGVPFLCMAVSGIYRIVWPAARVTEFFYVGLVVLAGTAVAGALSMIFELGPVFSSSLQWLAFPAVSVCVIVSARAFRTVLRESLSTTERRVGLRGVRTGVYGAGSLGVSFLRLATDIAFGDVGRVSIVGLFDDRPDVRRRIISGHSVRGGLAALTEAARGGDIDVVIVTNGRERQLGDALERLAADRRPRVWSWSGELRSFRLWPADDSVALRRAEAGRKRWELGGAARRTMVDATREVG